MAILSPHVSMLAVAPKIRDGQEISTLGAAWKWAALSGHITGVFPNAGFKYPKVDEKPPFQTRVEIERQIARGGLSDKEQVELWEGLFLTLPELADLLNAVRQGASQLSDLSHGLHRRAHRRAA